MVRTEALSITAFAVGAIAVLSLFVGGLPGMVTCGIAAILAIALGTVTLLRNEIERLDRRLAVTAVTLGALGLTAQWITHIAMTSLPT